jgi:hypothetical protein
MNVRKRFGSVLVIGALAVIGFAKPAAAQIGGGVSFLTNGGTGAGFAVNAAKDHWAHGSFSFAPTGDFSYHSNDGAHSTTYGGGVRANWHIANARNLQPFGEFLAGGIHLSSCDGCGSDNAFQLTYGAGVHIPMSPKWNLLAQFDIITAMRDDATDSGFRMTFGASVPWK